MPVQIHKDWLKAQWGEDRLLLEIFKAKPRGFYIEIGAYNGVKFSPTYVFEQLGWDGILVEAVDELCEQAARSRPNSLIVHAACCGPQHGDTIRFTKVENSLIFSGAVLDDKHTQRCLESGGRLVEIDVPAMTVDELLTAYRNHTWNNTAPWAPHQGWQIDLVSIDAEGTELDILRGFNLQRFKPTILIIENESMPTAIIDHMTQNGYNRFARIGVNDLYVRNDQVQYFLPILKD